MDHLLAGVGRCDITPAPGTYEGKFTLKLPGKPDQSIRFRKLLN